MASRIKAIHAYCPRIELSKPTSPERFMELITQRTTLSSGVVKNVQESEIEALIGLLLDGQPVHTGTAIYTPSIGLDGNFEINVRVDARILQAINAPKAFRGNLINAENVGKTGNELVELWNKEHPTDQVSS